MATATMPSSAAQAAPGAGNPASGTLYTPGAPRRPGSVTVPANVTGFLTTDELCRRTGIARQTLYRYQADFPHLLRHYGSPARPRWPLGAVEAVETCKVLARRRRAALLSGITAEDQQRGTTCRLSSGEARALRRRPVTEQIAVLHQRVPAARAARTGRDFLIIYYSQVWGTTNLRTLQQLEAPEEVTVLRKRQELLARAAGGQAHA